MIRNRGRRASLDSVIGVCDGGWPIALSLAARQCARRCAPVVLNPDASVNHRIDPLPYVERIISDLPREGAVIRQWPVDGFGDVRVQEGRIVIGLNFDYEWLECRYYDVAARQWQERVYIGRR